VYTKEFNAMAGAAASKSGLLKKNPLGYLIYSVLAGMYIGFGVLLVFTLSGSLNGAPCTKLVMGCTFGVALSLVVICGAELFTGNNMVMTAGMACRTVSVPDTLKLWLVCWLGNLLGGILLSVIFYLTGLDTDATLTAITTAAAMKMSAGPVALLMRGVLCNVLVCLAVWSGFRAESDAGKLIMVFWCLLAFFATGFEHSIANMTVLTVALLDKAGNTAITLPGYFYNLILVTIGNMAGGALLVGVPYYIGSREKGAA